MAPNVLFVVNVLLSICCHIRSGMLNMCIFVEDVFALSGALTVKGV